MAFAPPKPMLWPALLVGLVGLIWLASDTGWVKIDLPLGPFSVLIIALALTLYAYGK